MDETLYRASRLFKVLANPLTYQVVTLLRTGTARPMELADMLGRASNTIGRIARELKLADVIYYDTHGCGQGGRVVEFRLKDREVELILDAAERYVDKMRIRP